MDGIMKTDIKLDFMKYQKARDAQESFIRCNIAYVLTTHSLSIQTNSETEEFTAIGICHYYGVIG